MDITGKIIACLEAKGGVSNRTGSQWKTQDYVIETFDQYPRKCVFNVFGEDKIAQFNIQPGDTLTVSFDIDAHEWNGRWFNNIRAWKVERVDPAQVMAGGSQPIPVSGNFASVSDGNNPQNGSTAPFPPVQDAPAEGTNSADDLPF